MAQAQLGDDVQNEVKVTQPEGKKSEGVVGRCDYCDPLENKKAEGVRQDSNDSLGSMCRICHSGGSSSLLGTLKSPCYCRGTVALVHMACLERWLSASGTEFCELCGFRFRVERTARHTTLHSLKLWLTTDPDSMQMLVDLICFMVVTPFALLAAYLCVFSLHVLGDTGGTDVPWLIAALFATSCLTLIVYYGWVLVAIRWHVRRWYRWWRTTFTVRVLNATG